MPSGALYGSQGGGFTITVDGLATPPRVTLTSVPISVYSHAGTVAGPRVVWIRMFDRCAAVTCSGVGVHAEPPHLPAAATSWRSVWAADASGIVIVVPSSHP